MEKKPPNSGMPASDSVPTRNTMAVCGIRRARPPMRVDVVGADGVDHRAGAEEQQRLEHAVGEQVQEARPTAKPAPIAAIM